MINNSIQPFLAIFYLIPSLSYFYFVLNNKQYQKYSDTSGIINNFISPFLYLQNILNTCFNY